MSTPFFFEFHEIAENPAAYAHYDLQGNWVPSIEPGANIDVPAAVAPNRHISGIQWFCNRQRIIEVPQRPTTAQLYKTYTVYYVGGAGFTVLNGDARSPPGDDVFHRLQFACYRNDFTSYLTMAGQYPTLLLQPQTPQWAQMLLPTIYHSHHTTTRTDWGGLVGELPIFLALIAFSTSRELIPAVLPYLFQDGAWVTQHQWQMQQMDRRGLVVSVYTCPPGYSVNPPQNQGGSTPKDLYDYEQGVYGKYFY